MCLINVIASEALGAAYLIKSPELTLLLIQVLKSEQSDTNLRQNALGALQKFSLHRTPQTVMIDNDMIAWIINTLKKVPLHSRPWMG